MARTTIDLSRLPSPDAVEVIDHEAIWQTLKADILARAPDAEHVLALESEMIVKVGQAFAYRLMLEANKKNQAVRAVMPAFATGADLDHLGVIVGVARLDGELDDDFRRRFVLAPEGYSVAGPAGAYEFHALSADSDVKDAATDSPAPGHVLVTILSRTGDGAASAELVAKVAAVLTADEVRPLTDFVTVQSAGINAYAIEAVVRTYAGPDPSVVMTASRAAVEAFVLDAHRLGRDVNLSSIYAALTVEGVMRVDLAQPAANVVCNGEQAAHCTAITLTWGGVDE